MFASPGNTLADARQEREQLQDQLHELARRRSKLDEHAELVEAEAFELEGQIRALARDESALRARKHEISERARRVGDRRTQVVTDREKLAQEEKALVDSIAQLDEKIQALLQPVPAREDDAPEQPPEAPAAPTAPPVPVEEESRAHPRFALNIEVSAHTQHNFYTGLTENISEGGLFIATYENLPVGTTVDLTISLPAADSPDPIRTLGIVRWIREHTEFTDDVTPGVGVEFTQLKAEDQDAIQRFLHTHAPMLYETT